jgi:putative transport protein
MLEFFLSMKPQTQTVIIISLVIVFGMLLGKIKAVGITLGIGGVLFAGLIAGQIISMVAPSNVPPILNKDILEFLRELGLVLFVYTIGMQVGPGFFASLKKNGLFLNALAGSVVLIGVLTATTIHFVDKERVPVEVAVGLLSGATTNTPGLGAAQQVLADVFSKKAEVSGGDQQAIVSAAKESSAMSYAVSYPFGIVGIILAMISIRVFFKLNPVKSATNFSRNQGSDQLLPININLEVHETSAIGLKISDLAKIAGSHTIISRHMRDHKIEVANPDLHLIYGDIIHGVGPKDEIEKLKELTGPISINDLRKVDSDLISRRILITEKPVLGKTVSSLDLQKKYGVTVTRVVRAGVEFSHNEEVKLQFGDSLMAVGPSDSVNLVAKLLGDCVHKYNHPLLIPMFIGIALGTFLGAIPIPLGLPVPLKLGLAGGPLVAAIILSRIGRIGKLIFHIPLGANLWVRELGIVIFLACVGLMSGGKFVDTIINGHGLYWMMMGCLITFIPLFTVGFGARYFYKTNYMQLCGLLAGSMTDPPALAFANSIANSEGPAITYATVYPMVMLLRILTSQLFVIIISHFS